MKRMLATVAVAALMVGCSSAKMKKLMGESSSTKAASTTKASAPAGLKENTVTCTKTKKKHTDTRTILVAVEKNRCVVHYTKFGKTKEVASGKANSKHCATVQDHIKKSLVKAGFTCK